MSDQQLYSRRGFLLTGAAVCMATAGTALVGCSGNGGSSTEADSANETTVQKTEDSSNNQSSSSATDASKTAGSKSGSSSSAGSKSGSSSSSSDSSSSSSKQDTGVKLPSEATDSRVEGTTSKVESYCKKTYKACKSASVSVQSWEIKNGTLYVYGDVEMRTSDGKGRYYGYFDAVYSGSSSTPDVKLSMQGK